MKPFIYGLQTFGGCITCAVIAHYSEVWVMFLPVAVMFAMFAAFSVALKGD